MSSSIFIENPSVPKTSDECLDDHVLGINSAATSSSNLVVVYGKNGVNFDRKGLENLIEEKTLSSISVIRLTSPTPSMENEEAEAERLSEIKRKQDKGSDEDYLEDSDTLSTNDEQNSEDSAEDLESNTRGSESSDNEDTRSEDDRETVTKRCKKKQNKKHKKSHTTMEKGLRGNPNKECPEIVGLTVEEFYPPEDAKEMAKEILKLAGVSTVRRTADYEFQLYVIENDHCYTPFTSPAQMTAKLAAEKLDAEKSKTEARKLVSQNYKSVKQFITKKKLQQADVPKSTVVIEKVPIERENVEHKTHFDGKAAQNHKSRKIDIESFEHIDFDDVVDTSASEEVGVEFDESEFTASEASVESENDRESDLDFDVNNRKGRKRKVQNIQKPIKRNMTFKAASSKRNQRSSQEEHGDVNKPLITDVVTLRRSSNDNISRLMAKNVNIPVKTLSGMSARKAVAPLPTVIKKQVTIEKPINSSNQQTTLTAPVRRGPIVQVGTTSPRNSQLSAGKVPASPQSIKEIVINKVIASPKGGFTDIGALLSQPDIETISTPTTPTSSTRSQVPQKTTPSSKGFMPLGIETAAKNQLPSQISVQTHQSSSELAAEHDKQLDLIDSIVKDEMEKSSSIIEKAAGENEDIPQLVKMLESTERALDSKITRQMNEFNASSAIENDIDISNAPLMEPSEEEIPAELLQHVVELIEDDKTLQEAVEKQVFGEENNVNAVLPTSTPQMSSMFGINTANPKSIEIQIEKSTPTVTKLQALPELQTKSIIQATIFSDDITTSSPLPGTSGVSSSASKTIPAVRKEPIQIVRGNGRVITLPPIEAPTTRAKRRALKQPAQNVNTSATDYLQSTLNESLDTSLQSNTSADLTILTSSMLEKKPTETTAGTRRRVSKEGNAVNSTTSKVAKKGSAKKAAIVAKTASKLDITEDVSESKEDDDDPKKLWCICRQPHNNRFMICCDVCGDWFHGTCVSITKAMGLEMEQKGVDWTCPKCVKKLEEKKQRKITDMLGTKKTPVVQHLPATNVTVNDSNVDINQSPDTLSIATKPEIITKRQIIDIKKIQSGQFISLKNLEEKNLPLSVITSGQKRQFLPLNSPTTSTKSPTAIQAQPRRVIVVRKESAQKSDNSKKALSVIKTQHLHQLKVQKIPVSAANTSSIVISSNHLAAEAEIAQQIEPTTPCIVCKKPSRPNSIYCSDDCIRKHAQNALNAFTAKPSETPAMGPFSKFGTEDKKKKAKGLFEDLLLMADRKPKVERVYVFERKSGRFLTGNNAPTTANLKKWLQDNPTFEVIQPGSIQALEIEKKQKTRSSLTNKNTPSPSPTDSYPAPENVQPPAKKSLMFNNTQTPIDGQTKESSTIQLKSVKHIVEQSKLSPTLIRPQTPKQLAKYSQQVSLKSDKLQKSDSKDESKAKEKNTKRQVSEINKKPVTGTSGTETTINTTDSEPIRINVRRTLTEQLLQRINEKILTNDGDETETRKKPSAEYVAEFIKETELEMYNYFNRDTGAKYKAKYRSLMFNIKDRKNQTLFQKICAKVIKPSQLVRMSPEELASQELAQWRENEAKHQLEMIKKSELDLLSCAKNYVLKTHKGEEVIEGKPMDCVNLDMTIPVEELVSVLNNSTTSGNDRIEGTSSTIATRRDYLFSEANEPKDTQSNRIEIDLSGTVEDKIKTSNKEKEREKEKTHKNRDRHREKSKTRRRSRSRSRSREKRHKSSSHKDDKREREGRGHERVKEQRDRSKDEPEKRSTEKKSSVSISNTVHSVHTIKQYPSAPKDKHRDTTLTSTQAKKDMPAVAKSLESFSLIDQILESTKTVEEAANLVSEKNKVEDSIKSAANGNTVTQVVANSTSNSNSQKSVDSDQETMIIASIASSPQDPYSNYYRSGASLSLWSGNINMIDVASFQILIQPVIGNSMNMEKLFPEELDVVGRIGPDTVWDYISKIKKSPNKEIVILRLLPSCESETVAYTILYKYLHKRNRLGVIKTSSSQIKDFYIFPLVAGSQIPSVLQPAERVEFYEDPHRPDILVGIVIRVTGKRILTAPTQQSAGKSAKFHTKSKNPDAFTPPGSPKRKRLSTNAEKEDDIDIDAIIKAPIVAKKPIPHVAATSTVVDDQDEPYSPGCSSEDDLPLLKMKSAEYHKTAEEELKRKMDDLNRQIAAQEMEIAGLLNVEPKFIPPPGIADTPKALNPSLANISIPSNLSQILASIKHKPEASSSNAVEATRQSSAPPPPLIGSLLRSHTKDADEEYNPEQAIDTSYMNEANKTEKPSTSRLAQLSEAELLSMVPDDMLDTTTSSSHSPAVKKSRYDEPPPPGV